MSRRDICKYGLLTMGGLALMPLIQFAEPRKAFGVVTTLSQKEGVLSPDLCFPLQQSNLTYKWLDYQGVNHGTVFLAPVTNKNGNFTLDNLIEFNFGGNKINNRDINIKITVDSLRVTDIHLSRTLGNYFVFAGFASNNFWFQQNNNAAESIYPGCSSNQFRWFIYYTIDISWTDTGEIVDIPFYQLVSDIDSGTSYFTEAWTADDGFEKFYVYDDCYLNITNNTFRSPKQTVGFPESVTKAGVIATTTNGKFSGHLQLGNCGSSLNIYSSFADINFPKKTFSIYK